MLAARVAALVEFTRYAPEVFEESSDIVLERLMRRVVHVSLVVCSFPFVLLVLVTPFEDETSEDEGEEWYEDTADIPPLVWAKIGTLKVLRHRCLNAAVRASRDIPNGDHTSATATEKEKAEKMVGPVIKMLQALMIHEGAISENVKEEYVPSLHQMCLCVDIGTVVVRKQDRG